VTQKEVQALLSEMAADTISQLTKMGILKNGD